MTVADRNVTGALRIVATRDGERTRIATLRQEGLARCSRPLAAPGGAAKVVVAQLGPGFVRGDHYTLDVTVDDGADLVLEMQTAARAFGGGAASTATQRIAVGSHGCFVFFGEPLVAYDGAVHRSDTSVRLAAQASFAWLECCAPHESFARVTTSLKIDVEGRLAVHDVLRLTPERLDGRAFGSAAYLRAGMSARRATELVCAADAAASASVESRDVDVGVGSPAIGGVILRASGAHVAAVRQTLIAILEIVRMRDAEPSAADTNHG